MPSPHPPIAHDDLDRLQVAFAEVVRTGHREVCHEQQDHGLVVAEAPRAFTGGGFNRGALTG